MVKNLIFDFGKVLVDYDFMPLLDSFFKGDKEREAKFCKVFLDQGFIDECDREDIPFEEIIRKHQEQTPEFADALQFFYDNYDSFVTGPMPGMLELLTLLKAEGYSLYGLTNWCSAVHKVMAKYPVFKLLDGRVISSEEHLLKPQPQIYECLIERYGLLPEECVFTDDKAINVEGGEQVGIKGIVFKNAGDYEKELRKIMME